MKIKSIITVLFVTGLLALAFSEKASAMGCTNLPNNLRYGSRGEDVTSLQQFLLDRNYLATTPTGFFGNLTQSAVKKYQSDSGLPSTGLVMTLTRAKIVSNSCNVQTISKASISTPASQVLGTSTSAVVTPTVMPTTMVSLLPYSTLDFAGWLGIAGENSFTSQGLELMATGEHTVAMASYPGGASLNDYKFTVSSFVKRGTLILMSRFKDDQNYVACYFNGKGVEIVQRVRGEQNSVAYVDMTDSPYKNFFFNDINVSMEVKGNTVGCTMLGNESNVTFNNLDESLSKGTFGVQVWYEAPGVAGALLRKVSARSI